MKKKLKNEIEGFAYPINYSNRIIEPHMALPMPYYPLQGQPYTWNRFTIKSPFGSHVYSQYNSFGSPTDTYRQQSMSLHQAQMARLGRESSPYQSMVQMFSSPSMQLAPHSAFVDNSPPRFLSLVSNVKSIPLDSRIEAEASINSQAPPAKPVYSASKIFHLRSLYNLTMKLFLESGEISPAELDLSEIEVVLFVHIIKRKFGIDPPHKRFDAISSPEMTDMIMQARAQRSSKRIEERKKFVFKQAVKRLKQGFCRTSRIRFHPDNSQSFYEHYFGELVKTNNSCIETFFDPLNPKLHNPVYKTLSNEYLALLFMSPVFAREFLDFLQLKNFVPYCQQAYPAKIEKLLTRWEDELRKGADPQAVLKELNQYFLRNRQCKLPWSLAEMTHAAQSFLKFTKQPADL
jgi:hypothetical protein